MTERTSREISLGSVWHARLARNDPNWVMPEEQAGRSALIMWTERFQELIENGYVRFHQAASELADIEGMKPDLEAFEIAVEASPALDDRNLISADYVHRLQEENETLRGQHGVTKTRLAEEQLTTEGFISQLKEAREQLDEARGQRDTLLYTFREMKQSNEQLTELLEDKKTGQLLMFESYPGIVEASFEDSATIVFETNDDIVEHVYERDQFLNDKIPEEGQRVRVCFYLSNIRDIETVEQSEVSDREDDYLDLRSHRKNVVKGPHTF